MAIRVLTYLSPRIIEVLAPTTSISVQELTDDIKNWEDEVENLSFPKLVNTSGKENLGGGVLVGITAELQNAQIAFQQRAISDSAGTITTADNGTYLKDSGATFISDGINPGDTIINTDDGSVATILRVDSETQLYHYQLEDGSLNTWVFGDAYKIWNKIQCELNGGNVVAVDENGAGISAFMPTAFTHVIRTSASSATLQEEGSIQYSSFGGGVTLDVTSSYTGTSFPKGTPQEPINNMQDALAIATFRGFKSIFIVGDYDFVGTDTYDGYNFIGDGKDRTSITISPTVQMSGVGFDNLQIVSGTLDGESSITDCEILNLNYISGIIERCLLSTGTIILGNGAEAHFLDCWSGVTGTGTPTIDMGGSGQSLAIRNYNGGIKIVNKSGAEGVSIDMSSGQIKLGADVTNGTIVARGVGEITENLSSGITLVDTMLNPFNIWEEPMSTHTTAGTFGFQISKKLLTLAKWIGLK